MIIYFVLFLEIFIKKSENGTFYKITEKLFNRALGDVISNAKDWNSKRKLINEKKR